MKAGARRLSTGDIEPITGELWRLLRLSKPHMMLCSIYIGDTQGRLMRSYTRYGTVKPSTRKSPSATRPRKGLLHLTKSVRHRTPFLVNFGCMPSAFGSSDIVSLRTCELLLGKNEKVSQAVRRLVFASTMRLSRTAQVAYASKRWRRFNAGASRLRWVIGRAQALEELPCLCGIDC